MAIGTFLNVLGGSSAGGGGGGGGGTPAGSTGDIQTNAGAGAFGAFTPGANVTTALQVAIGTAGAPVVLNGAGGTPSSIVLTNATGTAGSLTVGNATNVGITDDTTTNATVFPTWVTANTGNLPEKVSSTKLTWNPSTANLSTTGTFTAGSGSASAGGIALTQGTTSSPGTTNVIIQAPATVGTSYVKTLEGAPNSSGYYYGSVSGTTVTETKVAGPANTDTLAGLAATQTFTGVETLSPAARTSGAAAYLTLNIPADTGQTASTESPGFRTVTNTRTWATTGTVATQRENLFAAPTYASASASQTFTKAATLAVSGPPIAGANAVLTNTYSFWVQSGNTELDGPLIMTPAARTTGNLPYINITPPPDTTMTSGAESPGIIVQAQTRTWAGTTGFANQREYYLKNPTYGFAAPTGTITTAATLAIAGAPTLGSNVAFTNAWALLVETGNSNFVGGVFSSSATAGIGYRTGAGGAIAQATNRTTGVTLNTITGTITTQATSLAALTRATFTVSNTSVALRDTIVFSVVSGPTADTSQYFVTGVAAGSFNLTAANLNAVTADTGAAIINFAVIKAANA